MDALFPIDKPLCVTFRTPSRCYCYDGNTGLIARTDHALFTILQDQCDSSGSRPPNAVEVPPEARVRAEYKLQELRIEAGAVPTRLY